jgi:transmembrane sensor
MSTLPDPIRDALDDELDEATIARLWRGTRDRMRPRERASYLRPAALVLGVGLAAAALFAVWPRSVPGGLSLASGEPVAPVATSAQTRRLELDDASSIELGPRSALDVRENDARRFATSLSRGRARFTVTPGTGRRWEIDCGLARIEVVGTVFILEHRSEGLWVEVERGLVRVHTSERSRDLGAGQRLLVRRAERQAETAPAAPREVSERHAVEAVPEPRAAEPAPRARRAEPEVEPWRVLAERGAHGEAYEALGPRGIDARVGAASARELLLMADVARLSGHPADAVHPLERLLAEHPRDAQAPLAAVILGRLEMDALHRPSRAVSALEQAIALGVPAALADDVEGRLAILWLTSGAPERGDSAAAAYLAARPEGRHARRLRALLAR